MLDGAAGSDEALLWRTSNWRALTSYSLGAWVARRLCWHLTVLLAPRDKACGEASGLRAHPSLTPSVRARLMSAATSLALVRHSCHHTTNIRGPEKTQPSEEPEKSSNMS